MLVTAAPAFGGHFAPVHVKSGLAALLAFAGHAAAVPVPAVSVADRRWASILAREMAIGLALSLSLQAVMAGAALGGHLTGNQLCCPTARSSIPRAACATT